MSSTNDEHARADGRTAHAAARDRFGAEVEQWGRVEQRYSLVRLLTFLGAALAFGGGVWGEQRGLLIVSAGLVVAFTLAVLRHMKVLAERDQATARMQVHARHVARADRAFSALPDPGEGQLDPHHAYGWDVDLVGHASLQRLISVAHTRLGRETLLRWLGAHGDPDVIVARQRAVAELRDAVELRQELEVSACLSAPKGELLDGESFRALAERESLFEARPWLTPVIFALPAVTLLVYAAQAIGLLPRGSWAAPVALQFSLLVMHQRVVTQAFNLGSARQGVVEAFERMLVTVERAQFSTPLLADAKARLFVGETPPSAHMARLRKWVSLGELRQQFLLWIVVNPLTLWDLHVLRGLEAWNREVGLRTQEWFALLGELEALSSLATLAALDPDATFPTIGDSQAPMTAEAIAHPLLSPHKRVANDVALRGPGTALIVTGSNMAGKSTLLRAVGLNVALALAGGPVCARRMTVPLVRLRASMRAQDNLEEGASYFHAELTKLRGVVEGAEDRPPVLFLLDELLRGTNERARHIGARAVLTHLLARDGSGLVATHDVALAALEDNDPRIDNVHFTDVVVEGEMTFDYRLRPGVVRTSNALRLLAMAGVDVPEAERRAMESDAS